MLTFPLSSAALAVALSLGPSDPDVGAAAEAFTRGQRAELAHDYARAAEFYELADSLAPAPEALRSAAKNWRLAGRNALAASRASDLLRRYPDSDQSVSIARKVLEATSGSLTRVEVQCDRPCLLASDATAVVDERALSHVFFLDPGAHEFVASFGEGRQASEAAQGAAGETIVLSFVAPPPVADSTTDSTAAGATTPPAGTDTRGRQRLSPIFFAVGAVATAGLAGATVWSGVNVLSQNDRYQSAPTQARYENGRRSETRTNVLIASTAVIGAATVVIAVFTRWKRGTPAGTSAQRRGSMRLTAGGMAVRF